MTASERSSEQKKLSEMCARCSKEKKAKKCDLFKDFGENIAMSTTLTLALGALLYAKANNFDDNTSKIVAAIIGGVPGYIIGNSIKKPIETMVKLGQQRICAAGTKSQTTNEK